MSRIVKPHSEKLDDVIIETAKGQEFTVGEIKHSSRIQKSATPKQDLSWYIKWTASIFILASMSMRGIEGFQMYDLILSLIGVADVGRLLVERQSTHIVKRHRYHTVY